MTLSAEKIFYQFIKMPKKLKPTHMLYIFMSFQGDLARCTTCEGHKCDWLCKTFLTKDAWKIRTCLLQMNFNEKVASLLISGTPF